MIRCCVVMQRLKKGVVFRPIYAQAEKYVDAELIRTRVLRLTITLTPPRKSLLREFSGGFTVDRPEPIAVVQNEDDGTIQEDSRKPSGPASRKLPTSSYVVNPPLK